MKKRYSLIHLPQNLQEKTTSVHTPIALQYEPITCTNEISCVYKPPTTQCLFLVTVDLCVTWRWSLWTQTSCKKNSHILITKETPSCDWRLLSVLWNFVKPQLKSPSAPWRRVVRIEAQLHPTLTSALDGSEWSTSRPSCFDPVNNRYPLDMTPGGPQRRVGGSPALFFRTETKFFLPRLRPRTA